MFYVACGVHNIELLEPDSILCLTTGKAFFNNAEMLAVCRHTADLTWTARMLRAARIVGIAANSRVHTIFQLCQSRSKQSWNCCVACNSQSFLCAIRCTARMRRTSRQCRTRMSVASHSPAVFAFNNNKKQNTISESMSWDCHYASHSTRCRRSFLSVSLPVSLSISSDGIYALFMALTLWASSAWDANWAPRHASNAMTALDNDRVLFVAPQLTMRRAQAIIAYTQLARYIARQWSPTATANKSTNNN